MLRDELIDPDRVYNRYSTAKLLFGDRRMDEAQRLRALTRYADRGILNFAPNSRGFRGCDIMALRVRILTRRREVTSKLDTRALTKLDEIAEMVKKNQQSTEQVGLLLAEAVSLLKELRAERVDAYKVK